jgi:hypothetical protein
VGSLHLRVSESIASNRRVVSTLHVVRFDSVPWPSRITADGSVLTLHRNVHHSGNVVVAYPVAGVGELTLRTGTLPERAEPYNLAVELARGTLDRLRNQMSLWSESGLHFSDEITRATEDAVARLSAALFLQDDLAGQIRLAEECLAIACPMIDQLCGEFSRQLAPLITREESVNRLGVRLVPQDGSAEWIDQLPASFLYVEVSGWSSAAAAPADLQNLATQKNRLTIVGPIWDAAPGGLPDHINQITEFEKKRIEALRYLGQTLSEIRIQPDWLHIASGLNGIGHRYLSFPQQIQLVVDLQHLVEEFNRDVPILISFTQPWGERLAWSVGGAQSIQIADLLMRHEIRLSGFGLEIDLDYWPHGSLVRDPLQWLDLIDTWSQFGLPLFLFLRVPTGYRPSDVATQATDRTPTIRDSLSPESQARHLQTVVSLALSRPLVRGVIWTDWRDLPGSEFPASGLYDVQGRRKPVAQWLQEAFEATRSGTVSTPGAKTLS